MWGPGFAPTDYTWPTIVPLATVWVPWLLMECPKWWFLPRPTPPTPPHHTPPHPTPSPIPPTPLLSILTAEWDGKNTMKFSHQR